MSEGFFRLASKPLCFVLHSRKLISLCIDKPPNHSSHRCAEVTVAPVSDEECETTDSGFVLVGDHVDDDYDSLAGLSALTDCITYSFMSAYPSSAENKYHYIPRIITISH